MKLPYSHRSLTINICPTICFWSSITTQIRHVGFISQFTTNICYIKGSHNSVADALLWIGITTSLFQLPNIDFKEILEAQKSDLILAKSQASDSSLKLEPIPIPSSNISIVCDISTGVPCPFLPFPFRRNIFNILHSLSYPGIRATQCLITAQYVWPNINLDVRAWTRACLHCHRSKIHRHTVSPPAFFLSPDIRFDHVHIDLVGPLPTCKGYSYLFTMVDHFTRLPEWFHCQTCLWILLPKLLSHTGFPALAFLQRSPQIMVDSLSPCSGKN